jgi:hypothetical protein
MTLRVSAFELFIAAALLLGLAVPAHAAEGTWERAWGRELSGPAAPAAPGEGDQSDAVREPRTQKSRRTK